MPVPGVQIVTNCEMTIPRWYHWRLILTDMQIVRQYESIFSSRENGAIVKQKILLSRKRNQNVEKNWRFAR